MMEENGKALAHPRLYLDIDGVVLADSSPFETTELNAIERYAPEVASRLGATGLELVWISTWGKEAAYLSERIEAFGGAIILPTQVRDIGTKRDALIADQERSPSPFVWVDDMINNSIRKYVSKRVKTPHLLVSPNTATGLTASELEDIEGFALQFQS